MSELSHAAGGHKNIRQAVKITIAVIMLFIYLFPFALVLVNSLKTKVAIVKTPLLLIQSQEDFRCERDQSFQMFTALKVLGVECRMCLFNGENHELSRSGRPRNRLARLREITSWFDKYLMN